ncbi:MAG: hypothetical protein EXQ99_08520 [Alphaproteobacteria bacterium]|nr:hypothetical protein [Alphaproteobacteria bacterium]
MKAPLRDKAAGGTQAPPKRSAEATVRLAKALRDNLKRRRAQKSARQEPDSAAPFATPADDPAKD